MWSKIKKLSKEDIVEVELESQNQKYIILNNSNIIRD